MAENLTKAELVEAVAKTADITKAAAAAAIGCFLESIAGHVGKIRMAGGEVGRRLFDRRHPTPDGSREPQHDVDAAGGDVWRTEAAKRGDRPGRRHSGM